MLGELLCWIFAFGLFFDKTVHGLSISKDYVELTLALGFIFVGAIYRGIDVRREEHTKKETVNTYVEKG